MTKRELFIMNPFETEGLVQYLEKKKEEGWGLSKLGYFYLYFEKQENINYNYAIDLVNHSDNDLDIYLDFMDTTGWTKIGNRGGIYVFKSETESQFFSDQKIDKVYHSTKVLKKLLFYCGLLLVIFAYYLNKLEIYGYWEDYAYNWRIVNRSTFYLLLVLFLIQVILPYLWTILFKKNISYTTIIKRSWIVSLGFAASIVYVLLYGIEFREITNASFIHSSSVFWGMIILTGCMLYGLRKKFQLLSIGCLIIIICGIISTQFTEALPKPLQIYPDQIENLVIDSYEIPFSLYQNEEGYILKENNISESILMKSYSVLEQTKDNTFLYDFYEAKYDYVADRVMNDLIELWRMRKQEDINGVEIYHSIDCKEDVVLRKGNIVVFAMFDYSERTQFFEGMTQVIHEKAH